MSDYFDEFKLERRLALMEARITALEAQPPSKKKTVGDDEMFDEFWLNYPKRAGKGAAKKAWASIKVATRRAVVDAAAEYGHIYAHATDEQLRFVPNPATWLNASGWEDDPKVWRANFAAYFPNMSRKTQLPLVGKGDFTPTKEQQDAIAKAQEERRKAERADLVARLKREGKLPKGYVEGDEGGPF